MDRKFNMVVVPDGLAANKQGIAINSPSMVFKAVLNHIANRYHLNRIFIAPANKFDGSKREEVVGKLYLKKRGCPNVVIPRCSEKSYVDTLGNAIFLSAYLKLNNLWPLENAILIVAKEHRKRAVLCFTSQGFKFVKIDSIDYEIRKQDRVVRRLFYYKYPNIHKVYEFFAYFRDLIRINFIRRFNGAAFSNRW
jgi:hypothetical protein